MLSRETLNKCFEMLGEGVDCKEIFKLLQKEYSQDPDKDEKVAAINSYEKIIHFLVDNFQTSLSGQLSQEEVENELEIKAFNENESRKYQAELTKMQRASTIEYKQDNGIKPSDFKFGHSKKYTDFMAQKKAEFEAKYNLPARLIPYESPQKIRERESIDLRRQALLSFVERADRDIFATTDSLGRSILHKMLGIPMTFGEEIILGAIEKTPDLKDYRCASPLSLESSFSSERDEEMAQFIPKISLLEFMIKQQGFSGDFREVKNIAIQLLNHGCEMKVVKPGGKLDEELLNKIISARSFSSGLAQLLCSYFLIEKEDATIFFHLLRRQEQDEEKVFSESASARSPAGRASSSLNRSSSAQDSAAVFEILKTVLDHAIQSGAINEAVDNVGESIPSFIFRHKLKMRESGENSCAAKLWNYFQAQERINKLDERLFLINSEFHGTFLHQVAKSKNAGLLTFCLKKINSFGQGGEVILEALNEKGRSALHTACAFGFDAGVRGLFSHEIANEADAFTKSQMKLMHLVQRH